MVTSADRTSLEIHCLGSGSGSPVAIVHGSIATTESRLQARLGAERTQYVDDHALSVGAATLSVTSRVNCSPASITRPIC